MIFKALSNIQPVYAETLKSNSAAAETGVLPISLVSSAAVLPLFALRCRGG